jgi:hypothetical protein
MKVSANLSKADRSLIIRVPIPPRRRGARKFVVGPRGVAWTGRRVMVDNAIVKALGRAHRWKAMLESGEYGSMTTLAQAEKINLSYLCRVLRLTLRRQTLQRRCWTGGALARSSSQISSDQSP